MEILYSNDIEKIIPHRHPFLLIDKVVDMVPGEYAKAVKCITASEPWFTGHFPQNHVMPGVLMVEAMAQTGAVSILSLDKFKGKIAFFAGIKNAKFRRVARPGDKLEIEMKIDKLRRNFGTGTGTITCDGELVVEAVLSFMIES